MNTEIRKIIERIESEQKELERLVNERTAIMKNERHLSTGNFRREMSIIENFIKRKSEEIMNERRTVENYTHANDLMRKLTLTPSSEEEKKEKEEELNSIMGNLSAELQQELINRNNNGQVAENNNNTNEVTEENTPQVSNEERLRTLQEALEVARNAYQASLDNFQTIFSNERNEIAERGPLNNEQLDEINSRYLRAKEEENERLQRSRDLITEIESKINDVNKTIEEENDKILSDFKQNLISQVQSGKITSAEMIEQVQAKVKELRKENNNNRNNENERVPINKSLVPVEATLTPSITNDTSSNTNIGEQELQAIENQDQGTQGTQNNENERVPINKSLVPVEATLTPSITNDTSSNTKGTQNNEEGIDRNNENERVPENKSLVPTSSQDTKEQSAPRGFYTIINEITEGLNVQKGTGKKYKVSNIKVSKEFKEELHSGNYLYNIVHFVPAVIKVPIKLIQKAFNKLRYSLEEKKTVKQLKERIENLDERDLNIIWEEYRGRKVIGEGYPDVLNILLNEKMQQYAMGKVAEINSSMEKKYIELFEAKKTIEKCDEVIEQARAEGKDEEVQKAMEVRQKVLSGKAELIKTLREESKAANLWLSGGAHGFEEDMKAAATKLSIVGKRFAKKQNLDPELTRRQAEVEQQELKAIDNNDNETALNAFIENETLLSGNTKIEQSIFGKRSTGSKYYEPLASKLEYGDDPFIRDLITTVAVSAAAISAANAIKVHGADADNVIKTQQDQAAYYNDKNSELIDEVHSQGSRLADNGEDFMKGMKAQSEENLVNHANTMERQTLDQTSWQIGTRAYRAADDAAHGIYNNISDEVQESIADIAGQYQSGIISQEAALDMLKEVANGSHQNLVELYSSYLPRLQEYAAGHPQFDLHCVTEAMDVVLQNPEAIAKMNEGMIESVQIGNDLMQLSAEQITALNSLPSDIKTTLFANGAAAVALAYNVSKEMTKKANAGKYGNEVTDMVSEYIANKESTNVETNTTSKNK